MSETPTPTPTPTPPPAPWYQGLEGVDDVMVGHLQTKGWDKLAPPLAAVAAIKAHREAEGYIGAPADQLLKLPKDPNDKDGWNKVWTRLGAPLDPKDYDFSGVKRADGTAVDEKLAGVFREAAGTLKLPKDAASGMAAAVVKHLDAVAAATAADYAATIATQQAELKTSWGQNFDANKIVAQRAAEALGVTPDTIAALEKQVGYSKVMEMFRSIGQKIGEDKFVKSDGPTPGVMTREQAMARKEALMKDEAWAKAYLNGDAEKAREMQALLILIVGDDTQAMRGRGA